MIRVNQQFLSELNLEQIFHQSNCIFKHIKKHLNLLMMNTHLVQPVVQSQGYDYWKKYSVGPIISVALKNNQLTDYLGKISKI